ncbi:MAG: hypothetical protein R3C15_07235 [Thermoleophilia bacterium]
MRAALRRVAAGLAACLAALVPGTAAHALTTTVRDVHVTQGTQTFGWWAGNPSGFAQQAGNTIPLVSGRSTAVRVSVEFGLGPGESLPQDVQGLISVTIAGQQVVASTSDFTLNAPWDPPLAPRPELREDDTLNFELPAGTLRLPTGQATGTAQFTVLLLSSTNAVLGGGSATLEMRALPKPEIIPVGIRYTPFSNDGPDAAFAQQGVADAFVDAALPIDDSCETADGEEGRCAYRPFGLVQEQAFDLDVNGNGALDSDADPSPTATDHREKSGLIEQLIAMRTVLVYVVPASIGAFGASPAPPEDTYVFGWLPAGALVDHGGAARVGGDNVGYGSDRPDFAPVAFAHEFVHMHDIVPPALSPDFHDDPSPQALLPNLGWDVGGGLIGNPPGTGVGRLRGQGFFDAMGDDVGRTIADGWLGAENYELLLEARSQLGSQLANGRRLAGKGRTSSPSPTVTITGVVTRFVEERDGRLRATAAELRPAFAVPGASQRRGSATAATTQVFVEAIFDANGRLRRVIAPVDARTVTNTHLPPPKPSALHPHSVFLGPFSVTLAARGRLVALRILDRQGRARARPRATSAGPRAAIASPAAGTALGARPVLRWRTEDRDSPASAMRYHVSFSPDGGATFLPVAVNLRRPGLALDPRRLPCTRQGIRRVHVSDGVNSSVTDVRKLVNRRCTAALRAVSP